MNCLQGCSRTLLSDICLRDTNRDLTDDVAFSALSPDFGDPSVFTVWFIIIFSMVGKSVFKKRRGAESFMGCFNQESRFSVN